MSKLLIIEVGLGDVLKNLGLLYKIRFHPGNATIIGQMNRISCLRRQ